LSEQYAKIESYRLNLLSFLVWRCFTELVQRIFKSGDEQQASLTPDKNGII